MSTPGTPVSSGNCLTSMRPGRPIPAWIRSTSVIDMMTTDGFIERSLRERCCASRERYPCKASERLTEHDIAGGERLRKRFVFHRTVEDRLQIRGFERGSVHDMAQIARGVVRVLGNDGTGSGPVFRVVRPPGGLGN